MAEEHKGYEIAWLINRSAFDQYLLEKAALRGRGEDGEGSGLQDSGELVAVQTKDGIPRADFWLWPAAARMLSEKDRRTGKERRAWACAWYLRSETGGEDR